LLCHRNERHTACVEHLDDLGEVAEGSREAVDFVDHHRIDSPPFDVDQETFEGGTFHGGTRATAVVIHLRQRRPTLMLLTEDEGLASLALSIERVEVLLEALFGGLAGIDRAAASGLSIGAVTHRPAPPR
jgi:hypothetical protein